MMRLQAVLALMTTARDEARLHRHLLTLVEIDQSYDLEAALDTTEHRLVPGRGGEAVLRKGLELARALLSLMQRRAACP
jgi:hypothetical protein